MKTRTDRLTQFSLRRKFIKMQDSLLQWGLEVCAFFASSCVSSFPVVFAFSRYFLPMHSTRRPGKSHYSLRKKFVELLLTLPALRAWKYVHSLLLSNTISFLCVVCFSIWNAFLYFSSSVVSISMWFQYMQRLDRCDSQTKVIRYRCKSPAYTCVDTI